MTIGFGLTISANRLYWRTTNIKDSLLSDAHNASQRLCLWNGKGQNHEPALSLAWINDGENTRYAVLTWIRFDQFEADGDAKRQTIFRWHALISEDHFKKLGADPFLLVSKIFNIESRVLGLGIRTDPQDIVSLFDEASLVGYQNEIVSDLANVSTESQRNYLAGVVSGITRPLVLDDSKLRLPYNLNQRESEYWRVLKTIYLALPTSTRVFTEFTTLLNPEMNIQMTSESALIAFSDSGQPPSKAYELALDVGNPEHKQKLEKARNEYVEPLFQAVKSGRVDEVKTLVSKYQFTFDNNSVSHFTPKKDKTNKNSTAKCFVVTVVMLVIGIALGVFISSVRNGYKIENIQKLEREIAIASEQITALKKKESDLNVQVEQCKFKLKALPADADLLPCVSPDDHNQLLSSLDSCNRDLASCGSEKKKVKGSDNNSNLNNKNNELRNAISGLEIKLKTSNSVNTNLLKEKRELKGIISSYESEAIVFSQENENLLGRVNQFRSSIVEICKAYSYPSICNDLFKIDQYP